MSTSIHIRSAHAEDIPSLVALLDELSREEGYRSSIGGSELFRVLFGDDRRIDVQALVADDTGEAVGTVLYYWGFDTVSASYGYHLADMIITKSARRKSIGTQLFKALAAECLQRDGQWISLTVLQQNSAAKSYYQSLGLTKVDVDFFAIGPKALAQLSS